MNLTLFGFLLRFRQLFGFSPEAMQTELPLALDGVPRQSDATKLLLPADRKLRKKVTDHLYYMKHRDRLKALNKKWYERHPGKKREQSAAYRLKYPEKMQASRDAWSARNKERRRKTIKEWQQNHPEKVRETARAYYWRNPEVCRKKARDWHLANRDRFLVRFKKYRKNNPEKFLEYKAKRRALIQSTTEERELVRAFYKHARTIKRAFCYYCQKVIIGKRHVDHITPLSRGGRHTVDNLCISHPSCNQSKHEKLLCELRQPQMLLL